METIDILGQPVAVGDTIAGAFRDSTRAFLRVGKILSFGTRGNQRTIKVHWTTESPYGAENSPRPIDVVGAIEAGLQRFIKVNA